MRENSMLTIQKVLVPTDFSEPAAAALQYARTLAAQFSATLHVVHVAEDLTRKAITAEGFISLMPDLQRELEDAARQRLASFLARAAPGMAAPTTAVVTSNATGEAIATYARDHQIDVIVIGTHGRGGVSRLLLGSVAERVVRTAPCPVLTVHADPATVGAAA
jgi:nucleotide-binding universal stress UspA family protein